MRTYFVFNLDQTTGLENYKEVEAEGSETLLDVEQYVKNTGATIKYSSETLFLKNSCCMNFESKKNTQSAKDM